MAFEQHGSARTSETPTARARTARRTVLAAALATLLVLGAVVPAGASWPVATRSSYLSQGYHTGHRADDIAADGGTPIVPIRSGRVVFAGWKSNCGGYQVWLSHCNGLYSAYYHMSRLGASKGEWVTRQSEAIGRVGRSGCASGSHLHVEVWRGYPWRSGSYRVNPWRYIDDGYYLPKRYR